RVQLVDVVVAVAADLLGLGGDVEGVGGVVDDRGAGDADLGHDVVAADVAVGHGGDAVGGVDEAALPVHAAALAGAAGGPVGVEGVDAVVLRGGEDDVARAAAGDGQVGLVERLGVDVAVHGVAVQLAEVAGVDVGGGEHLLARVMAGEEIVVVPGQHVD